MQEPGGGPPAGVLHVPTNLPPSGSGYALHVPTTPPSDNLTQGLGFSSHVLTPQQVAPLKWAPTQEAPLTWNPL
jgi:hypothetical protein